MGTRRTISAAALALAMAVMAIGCSDTETTGPEAKPDVAEGGATLEEEPDPTLPGPVPEDLATPAPDVQTSANSTLMTFSTEDNQFDAGVDNQGWYSETDGGGDSNDNYIAGRLGGEEHRNFFTFDLSALDPGDDVVGATLEVTRFSIDSDDQSETYSLFDVDTDAASLNDNDAFDAATFNDIGSGTGYGDFTVSTTTGSSGDVLSFDLNSAALADIEAAAGGFFSVGGCVPTADDDTEWLYGFSGGSGVQRLVLEVAPSSNSGDVKTGTSSSSQAKETELVDCKGVIEVAIDILPFSTANNVALDDPGLLWVALLTTEDFDASSADPSTITLGDDDGSDTPVADPPREPLQAKMRDVDGDSDADLLLGFDIESLVDNGDLDGSSESLTMNGQTNSRDPFRGSDAVVPNGGRENDSGGDDGAGDGGRNGGGGGGDDGGRGGI